MFDDCELGKSHPCHGEFKCSNCGKKWKSTKAWTDSGQNCKNCNTLVRPTKLSKNFVYICRDCLAMWHSSYSASGLRCRNCRLSVLILPLDPDDSQDHKVIELHKKHAREAGGIPKLSGEHDEALCEKCKIEGQPCRNTVDGHTTTPTTSILNHHNKSNTTVSITS